MHSLQVTFVLLVLSLAASTVSPQNATAASTPSDLADEAQFHFDRGNTAYRKGDFEAALAAYYASNRLVPNRNVAFNIARCLEKLSKFDEAFRAWSGLLASEASAEERERISAAIEALSANLALVSVESEPPGALVYYRRRDLGSLGATPTRLALEPGQAHLILDLPGYHPAEVDALLQTGREVRLKVKLKRIFGDLEVRQIPEGAEVRRGLVDGPLLRKGPGTIRLETGRVVLFVSAPGFATSRFEVDVKPATTVIVDAPLSVQRPPTGILVVQANVDGALVKVDGREMEFTPAVIEGLVVGPHTVEVEREGRTTFKSEVVIEQNERVYLNARLRRADPEVSAATKSLVSAEQAPGAVSVITSNEIAAFGWLTLAEALQGLRGIFGSYDRAYQSVGFQGFSPPGDYTKRILVLVDGHPLNDVLVGQNWVGHDFDVDLANVQRIEVVRGPGSVLYGTSAVFGVVNVVTRGAPKGASAELGATAGTLGLQAGRLTLGYGTKGDFVRVSAAGLNQLGDRRYSWNDGSLTTPDTVAERADEEQVGHLDFWARLGRLSVRAGLNRRKKDVPTGAYDTLPLRGTTYSDRRSYVELRGDIPLASFVLTARAAFDESRFTGVYQLAGVNQNVPEPYEETLRARWATGELRLSLPSFWGQSVTIGAEAQNQFSLDLGEPSIAAQREANAEDELVVSGYFVDDMKFSDSVRLNFGVRADHYTNSFGSTVNPRVALMLRPYANGNTKVLAGRAFRAPTTYERFYNDGDESQKAARDLQPETIVSLEIEHAHHATDSLTALGSVFANQVNDLIVLAADPEDGLLAYQNRGNEVRGFGGTGELRWDPATGTTLVAAYTVQSVRSYASGESEPFINAPTDVASLRSIWSLIPGKARLSNEVLYDIGRRDRDGERLDDALIWNVSVSGDFRPLGLRYFAGVFNVLDVVGPRTGFPVGPDLPSPTVARYGRQARLGVSYRF